MNTVSSAMMGVSRARGDPGHGPCLLGGHGLLDEGEAERLDVAQLGNRVERVQSLVVVDPEIDVVRKLGAQLLQTADVLRVPSETRS